MTAGKVRSELKKYSSLEKKKILSGFFKTGKGQYGEGDIFLGVVVPNQRIVAKLFCDLPFDEIEILLKSKIHEERFTALFILIFQFEKGLPLQQKRIVAFYKKNISAVNNWDLVDLSAPKILGPYLLERDKKQLYTWARSKDLWKRRVAIITTFHFIRNNQFDDTLKIATILLHDSHDLIHKAVGWMLREVGKRDLALEESFLKLHHLVMPRTMLRYAIERFPATKRKFYL